MIWERAGLTNSNAQWLLEASDSFANHFWVFVAAFSILLTFLEQYSAKWNQHRRVVIASLTFLLNAGVLVGLATVTTAALLAIPLLLESE